MLKLPDMFGTRDSSEYIAVPVHVINYVTKDGEPGEVYVKAGHTRLKGFNENEVVQIRSLEDSVQVARRVLFEAFGIDHRDKENDNCVIEDDDADYFVITGAHTVYVYDSEADGSSA